MTASVVEVGPTRKEYVDDPLASVSVSVVEAAPAWTASEKTRTISLSWRMFVADVVVSCAVVFVTVPCAHLRVIQRSNNKHIQRN